MFNRWCHHQLSHLADLDSAIHLILVAANLDSYLFGQSICGVPQRIWMILGVCWTHLCNRKQWDKKLKLNSQTHLIPNTYSIELISASKQQEPPSAMNGERASKGWMEDGLSPKWCCKWSLKVHVNLWYATTTKGLNQRLSGWHSVALGLRWWWGDDPKPLPMLSEPKIQSCRTKLIRQYICSNRSTHLPCMQQSIRADWLHAIAAAAAQTWTSQTFPILI